MTDTQPLDWMKVWGGAALAGGGIFVYLLFFLLAPLSDAVLLGGAAGLAILVALSAWLVYRSGRREMAIGIVGGYGLLALISGGQCVLIPGVEGGGGFGLAYPLILIIGIVVTAMTRSIRGRRKDQS